MEHPIDRINRIEWRHMSLKEIKALIERRRRQILVHSTVYYVFDENIIDDYTWANWADELVCLQETYPDISCTSWMADEFKDFDASTGYNLPIHGDWAMNKAQQLLAWRDWRTKNE